MIHSRGLGVCLCRSVHETRVWNDALLEAVTWQETADLKPAIQSGIALPEVPIPNPAAVEEVCADGWALLVNPDTAGAMAVNQTGALVWKLANGRRTAEEIAAAVRNRFPGAPDTIAEDVRAFLVRLVEEGFIGREMPLPGPHR
jgi:hypothetical protein